MSDTPSSSPQPDDLPASADTPAEKDEFEAPSSVLADTPDVDVEEYLEAQKRAARRARMILQFALGIIVVAVPVAYLRMSGHLSRASISNAIHNNNQGPAQTPPQNPGFSVATQPGASPGPATMTTTFPHTKKDPAIAKDLNDYVWHDLKAINPHELKALTAFQKVTGKNFRNSSETFDVINTTVLPEYAQFVKGAEALHPKTTPVQAIHRLLLLSAKLKLLAFRHTMEGQSDPDGLWQFGVKAEFDASGQLANQFKVQVNQLGTDQGVKLP